VKAGGLMSYGADRVAVPPGLLLAADEVIE
jgi:hypothetical protein